MSFDNKTQSLEEIYSNLKKEINSRRNNKSKKKNRIL